MNESCLTSCIVLATYNGEKYLREQLDSIKAQLQQPNEVVIIDDGSTDKTVEVASRYIKDNHLTDNWAVYCNDTNLGYVGNFIKGCKLSTSDVILFSDQDDIWDERKIAETIKVFDAENDALVVACGSTIIDQEGVITNTLQTSLRKTRKKLQKISLEQQVASMLSSGLTLGVRRSFMLEMIPVIERNRLTYDIPLGLFAAARRGFYRIGDDLVFHRVHSSNVSAPTYSIKSRLGHPDAHIEGRKLQLIHIVALRKEYSRYLTPEEMLELDLEIEKRKDAIRALEERDLTALARQLLHMGRMSNKAVCFANLAIGFVGSAKGTDRC